MKIVPTKSIALMAISAAVMATACTKDDDNGEKPGSKSTIKQQLEAEARFSMMNEAVEESEQSEFFSNSSANITLFAANNTAFNALFAEAGVSSMSELEAQMGEEAFADMVLYHAVNGRFNYSDFNNGNVETYATAENDSKLTLLVEKEGETRLFLNGADEKGAATIGNVISASNGAIIEVEATLAAQTNYEQMEDAEEQSDAELFMSFVADAEASVANRLQDASQNTTVLLVSNTQAEASLNVYLKNVLEIDDLENLLDDSEEALLINSLQVNTLVEALAVVTVNDLLSISGMTMTDIYAELETEDFTEIVEHFMFDGRQRFEEMSNGATITSEAGIAYSVSTNSQGEVVLTDAENNSFTLMSNSAQNLNGSVYTLAELN